MKEKIFFKLVHVQKEQKIIWMSCTETIIVRGARSLNSWVLLLNSFSFLVRIIWSGRRADMIKTRWTVNSRHDFVLEHSNNNQIYTRFFNMKCLIVYYKIPFTLNFDKYFFICIVKRTNQQPTDTQFFDLCTYHTVWHHLRSSDSVRKVYT